MKLGIDDYGYETWADEVSRPSPLGYRKKQNFYDSVSWRELRRKVLKAYGHACAKCKITTISPHVDHIKPRSLYPQLSLDFNNLQVLCAECNIEKGADTRDYRP